MRSVIKRGYVTDHLLKTLADNGFSVGDAIAPEEGGWNGDPGASGSQFVPYLVLTSGTASSPSGTLGDSSSEWQLNYSLASNGVSRRQVEDLADDARLLLSAQRKVSLSMGADSWRIVQVMFPSLGSVTATTAVDPTQFAQVDSFQVMLSKSPS